MTPAQRLTDRLDRVRETGPGRWIARCPAHDDRTPSLSVRETDDGTVLLRCWGGCGASEVVSAVGLGLRDLFSSQAHHHRSPLRRGERWVPRDVLAALSGEATYVAMAAEAMAGGEILDDSQRHRLATASGRLWAAAREVGHG